jgi:hypothetical protein
MSGAYLDTGDMVAGRYEIRREIGRGGYSVVYAATDRTVGTEVAIKLLVPPPLVAQSARERLRREVEAARALSHPNIVAVHDLIDDPGRSCVVMELVDGVDLAVRVRTRGPVKVNEAVSIGSGIADALRVAHGRGVLHRDVKPQNILLARDGRARLTDFGSAKLESQVTMTQTGALVGTMGYVAPEVIAGGRGDARADIYGLGATLYFALSGNVLPRSSPHLPPTPAPGGYHVRAVRSDAPEWLDAIVARMTSADPSRRYPAASMVADALRTRTVQVAERDRWARIPPSYYGMLALVAGVGTARGLIAHQVYYLVVSPALATALAAGAYVATGPARDGLPTMTGLPLTVRRRVTGALGKLGSGSARALLVDLVTVSALPTPASERRASDVASLVTAACDAALHLDRIDQTLTLLDSRGRSGDAMTGAEAARDRIVQQFLDAITVVGTARGQADSGGEAEVHLAEMTTELARTVGAEAAAAQEIGALLGQL